MTEATEPTATAADARGTDQRNAGAPAASSDRSAASLRPASAHDDGPGHAGTHPDMARGGRRMRPSSVASDIANWIEAADVCRSARCSPPCARGMPSGSPRFDDAYCLVWMNQSTSSVVMPERARATDSTTVRTARQTSGLHLEVVEALVDRVLGRRGAASPAEVRRARWQSRRSRSQRGCRALAGRGARTTAAAPSPKMMHVCGRGPTTRERLAADHEHVTEVARLEAWLRRARR
jgi:hypothetical protein